MERGSFFFLSRCPPWRPPLRPAARLFLYDEQKRNNRDFQRVPSRYIHIQYSRTPL